MMKGIMIAVLFVVGTSINVKSGGMKRFQTRLYMSQSSNESSIQQRAFGFLNKIKPLLGFYAVMLAPIYGIGLPIPFLGSMTDFSTLRNRGSPGTIANEYIVAPMDFTPARIDQVAPEYNIPSEKLKEEINKIVMKSPRITYITEDKDTNRVEYVQRTLIFRFPDVITWQILPVEDNPKKSTFAVHSYSIYGAGDLGVNGNRVRGWIRELNSDIDNLVKKS